MKPALITGRLINVAAIWLSLFMVGCMPHWFDKPAPIPPQPDAPTQADNMTKVGDQIDKSDARVAAAVTVAQRHADNAAIVKAETGVALSYLPKPALADVEYAERRAAKADAADYKAAEEYGRKLLASIDANWDKMEADRKQAKLVSDLKDKRIADQEAKIAKLEKDLTDSDNRIWTLAGIAFVGLGAVIGWLMKSFKGATIFVALGFACGAYPRVVDSKWFPWVVGGSIGCLALGGLVIWFLNTRKKPASSDEQTPKA